MTMIELETPLAPAIGRMSDESVPVLWVMAIGTGIASILALSVSAQTYLSMLDHGHSFRRILAWQLASWMFWGLAAPLVLRRVAESVARRRRGWRDALWMLGFGAVLMTVHAVVDSQLTIWFQPLLPMVTYDFTQAFMSQLPARFATDLLVYVLLLVGGGALSTYRRAGRLELRESRLEAELARARLHALRLEIEPHFLFNTLNAIAALIRLKDNERALDMLVQLSHFMRSNLDDPQEPFVPLSTEIEWVKRYVSLQQTRFGERLDVDYQVDGACVDIAVPTLLLQPLVENAFRHGVARQAQRCRIVIGATMEHHRLTLWVADDGVGLRPNFDMNRESGTGLRNTRSRLEYIYGTAATLQIQRGERAGTSVVIALPVTAVRWEGQATA